MNHNAEKDELFCRSCIYFVKFGCDMTNCVFKDAVADNGTIISKTHRILSRLRLHVPRKMGKGLKR